MAVVVVCDPILTASNHRRLCCIKHPSLSQLLDYIIVALLGHGNHIYPSYNSVTGLTIRTDI